MQQVSPIQHHQQQPDDKRAGNVDQKSRQRKASVVMFVDRKCRQIARERTSGAAGQYEKRSNQQTTDFSALILLQPVLAKAAKLSA